MKKPGIIPRLQLLPPNQIDMLVRWLTEEGLTYAQARKRLLAEFNVQTSCAALSQFWHQVCEPRRFAQLRLAERAQAAAASGNKLLLQIEIYADAENKFRIRVSGPSAEGLTS